MVIGGTTGGLIFGMAAGAATGTAAGAATGRGIAATAETGDTACMGGTAAGLGDAGSINLRVLKK